MVLWCLGAQWSDLVASRGWKPLMGEDAIHKTLIRRNTTQLAMSADTPFTSGKIAEEIGLDGESDHVENILEGEFEWEGYNNFLLESSIEMKTFLQKLKRPLSNKTGKALPNIESHINLEEYKEIFNNTKESTSSHPPIHYGHYKASCESDTLASVNLAFMNIPFKYGYPLERWRHSLHCMLQKKSKPWVNKLRIVQLFEADFNSVLKCVLGRRLMAHSEFHELNSPQLYGSRKKKSTIEALVMLRVMYDMARLDRLYMVSLFNDLKGCYDKIRPSLNTITMRRLGCPKSVAVCQAATLRTMQHALRTSLGVSKESILWDPDSYLGGIGQDSGGGPLSWHSQGIEIYTALTGD